MRLGFAAARHGRGARSTRDRVTATARLRILVVDDDPVLLRSLRDTLEGDGHTIVTANGGQDGIERVPCGSLKHGPPFSARHHGSRHAVCRRAPGGHCA